MRDPGTSSLYQLKVLHWRAGISHWILLVLAASESRSLISVRHFHSSCNRHEVRIPSSGLQSPRASLCRRPDFSHSLSTKVQSRTRYPVWTLSL